MIARRNYPLLLVSQFLGAFGDNAILAVILGQLTFQQQAGKITESQLSAANAIYTSLLFVPYVLLAPLAGYLNDRYAKTRWLSGGNLIKLLGTLIGSRPPARRPRSAAGTVLRAGCSRCASSAPGYRRPRARRTRR